ncbi:UvrD-helicase domain-containing protein, partial [Escherichia coli]
VMVDEFQDTDPLQWEILASAFHGRSDLWLIGDPKQSIYAFRGADIHAYLAATRQVDHTYELTTNWRSDQGIVDGVDQL